MTHDPADRQMIFEAVSRYCFGYDDANFDLLAEAFTADASSKGVFSGGTAAWGPMNGRDEIVSTLREIRQGQPDQPRHNITNFLFLSQEKDSARARFYLDVNSTVDDQTAAVSAGVYDAEFARAGEIWQLTRLDAVLDRKS